MTGREVCAAAAATAVLLLGGCTATNPRTGDTTAFRSTAAPVTFTLPALGVSQPTSSTSVIGATARSVLPPQATNGPTPDITGTFATQQSDPLAIQTTELPGITPMTRPLDSEAVTTPTDLLDPVRTAADFATRYWTRRADDSQTDNWAIRTAPLCTPQLTQHLFAEQLKAPGRPVLGTQTATVLQASPRPYPAPTPDQVTITMRVDLEQPVDQLNANAEAVLTFNVTMHRQANATWKAAALISQAN